MGIDSDWGDWLPRQIRDSNPAGVAIWYLGCNGFVLKDGDGTTIFIDPYLGIGDPPRTIRMIPVPFDPRDVRRADAILVTHKHVDHTNGPSQGPILAGTAASLYGPRDSVEKTREESWTETYDIGETYDIDLGVLACGSVGMMPDRETLEPKRTKWYNDEAQLIEAATRLRLDRLLPSHWDMWKRLTATPTALHSHVRSFRYPRRIELVEIGDRIALRTGR